MTTATRHITQAHADEWIKGSAVSELITRRNVESLGDLQEIARRLGWKGYLGTPGWWVFNTDPRTGKPRISGQFKPDSAIQFPDGASGKYLSGPKGGPVEAFFADVGDPNYWTSILDDPTRQVIITEGSKKAASAITAGIPAISISGVWCGQIDKKKLIPDLELIAVPGRPICLVFDSDILFKPEVQQALTNLGKILKKVGCFVTVAELPAETKGLDDLIVSAGNDQFKKLVGDAVSFETWLKKLEGQFQRDQKQKAKGEKSSDGRPPEVIVAAELVEKYRPLLAWNDEIQSWLQYEALVSGVWAMESDIAIEGVIAAELDSDPHTSERYSYSYLCNVIKLMRPKLLVRHWDTSFSLGLVPLKDGVLHLESMELRPHAPGYRLLWCLPFAWKDRAIGCEPIQAWMLEAMRGDRIQVEVLRAYLNAIVTGRTDLHRYLECVGPGSSGKGTYTRLAMSLIGAENTSVTTLEQLEKNRFETAGIYGKRLLLITDSERYGGEVSVLKAITGGDPVRYERKNVQQTKPFVPTCMVVLASNEPVQSSDYTSGLERRRLTMPFVHQVKAEERRDLESEFKPYLPGLLAWVLEMPDERVVSLVRNTSTSVRSLAKWKSESLLDTNPLAEWLDFCVVHDQAAKTYVGVAKRSKDRESSFTYLFTDTWLYPSYAEHITCTGSKPVSGRRFSTLLHDLCVNQLKLKDIRKGRDNRGAYFEGLAIRHIDKHDGWPRPITSDDNPPDDPSPGGGGGNPSPNPPSDGTNTKSDGKVTAETRTSDGSDGSDGKFQSDAWSESENKSQFVENSIGAECEILPSLPSLTLEVDPGQGFQPSPLPSPTHHNPSPSVTLPSLSALKVGDTVRSPNGEIGIVSLLYSDGLLGVDYENGRKFSRWEASELIIVELDGGNDPDGDDSGGGNQPVSHPPTPDDDGGGADESLTEPQQHQQNAETSSTNSVEGVEVPSTNHQQTSTPASSQQLPLNLNLVEPSVEPIELPRGVEWLDPQAPQYPEQCEAIANASIIALDIETSESTKPKRHATPKALHPWESCIRLIQLCIGERTFVVDLGDRNSNFDASLTKHQKTIDLLRQVIQNPQQRIVGHNIHFDLRFLATKLGIRNAKNVVCTRVGAQVYYGDYGLLEGDNHKGKHESILKGGYSLANLAQRLLDKEMDKGEQKSDWGAELTSEQIRYAAEDPKVTLAVYHKLESLYADKSQPLYSETLRDCWTLECDVVPCAVEIELAGMPIDIEAARSNLDKIEAHRQKLLEDWTKLCPDINYTQQAKLISFLNAKYQLGLTSLSKTELSKEARENPVVQIMLKLQGLKIEANTLNGFLASAVRDGRVHTCYKTLTGTGRFSAGGKATDLPNMQSIKAKSNPMLNDLNLPSVREVIKPQKGRTMAVVDLAGAHARIAASETQDAIAIAGSNDPSIDNHLKVAVFVAKSQGIDWSAEYIGEARKDKTNPDSVKAKLFRDTAKNTYYGWLNGAGAETVQRQIRGNTGSEPPIEHCVAAIEGCKALYPGVLEHRKQLMYHLRTTAIDIDGRPCAVNNIRGGFRICMPLMPNNKYNEGRLEAPYASSIACIWSRIEATAVKRALVQIMAQREAHPEWNLEVINYVHDEIDVEVDTDFASVAVPLVNDIIGDCFASLLDNVSDGRETDWEKLVVNNWSEK